MPDEPVAQGVPPGGAWTAAAVLLVLGTLLGFAFIQAWPPAAGAATPSAASSGCGGPVPSPATTGSPTPVASLGPQVASGSRGQASPSPVASPTPTTQTFAPACLYGFINLPTTPDGRLLTVVLIAGAIGGTIYALRSLAMFAGNRTLVWSWMPLYAVMPLVGGLLGEVFYVILRAGFLSPSTPTSDVSPYGFAAIAALAGLFAGQALEKLKNIFEQIFAKIPDHADPVTPVSITSFTPDHAKVGEAITIIGTGLSRVTLITFSGNATATPGADATDTRITVTVPAGATDGPIAVSGSGSLSASSTRAFTVVP